MSVFVPLGSAYKQPLLSSLKVPLSPQSCLFLFNHISISENLPNSEFEFAGTRSNVINRSTRKGLTVLGTTDSPYPGWQAYELCSATFILDIWTFLVYTHPFSCHSARILWIPLANSRSRLLNKKKQTLKQGQLPSQSGTKALHAIFKTKCYQLTSEVQFHKSCHFKEKHL